MELTDKERNIVLELIKMAWSGGAVRSEEQAAELTFLKLKLSKKEPPKEVK